MNKPVPTPSSTVFCSIDVSAGSLALAPIEPDHPLAQREFPNSVARKTIAADAQLQERFHLLMTTPGIAQISAIQLLAETIVATRPEGQLVQ